MTQSSFIRRETKIHSKQNEDQKATHLYKIEGLEFLPQGFLELDPLLFHDEFAFENDLHKDIFSEEQRRLKAIRRKQYAMRDKAKMRNITLFIADEKTERVIQFLEKWYFKKRRKMNEAELKLAAQELEIDYDSMAALQENYLNYKKIQNTKDLHDYLVAKGRIKGDQLDLPENLKKYFVRDESPSQTPRNQSRSNSQKKFKNNGNSKANLKVSDVNFNPENSQQFNQIKDALKKDQNLQEYFDGEIDKILTKIKSKQQPNQFANYEGLNTTKNSIEPKEYDKVIDQGAIDEIVSEMIKGKNNETDQNQNPKHLYQEMMKQKLAKSKFTNPKVQKPKTPKPELKTPTKESKNQSKKSTQKQKKVTIKNDDGPKQVNLYYQTIEGEIKTIQKLEPLSVGNQIFFMSIEEHIPKSGEPTVNLVTRDQSGVVIAIKPIQMENLGQYFQGKVFIEPQMQTNFNAFQVVVENERGNSVAIQKFNEKIPVFLNEEESLQNRQTISDPSASLKTQTRNQTVHVLQPINYADQFYQQVVKEIIDDENNTQLQIITHDKNGTVLAQDDIQGEFGNEFSSIIGEDFVNQRGEREFSIVTMDNDGNFLSKHFVTTPHKEEDKEMIQKLQKGRLSQLNVQGKVVRTFSIPAEIFGTTFFKQKLYEVVDKNGKRERFIITLNENGEILGKDFIDENHLGKAYVSQIVKNYDSNGMPVVLLSTKNDRNETISMKEFPAYHNEKGCKFIKEFENKSKGKNSYDSASERKSSLIGKNIVIRPVIYQDKFYQQVIEESVVGQQRKVKVDTKDENGKIIATQKITPDDLQGTEFFTKIAPIEDTNKINIMTMNMDNKIIAQQEIPLENKSKFDDQYVEEFDKQSKGKNVRIKQNKFEGQSITNYELRPATIGKNTFNQNILDIEDQYGEKERILMTRDTLGNIIALDTIDNQKSLDDNLSQKFLESNPQSEQVIISIFNGQNQEVAKQQLNFKSKKKPQKRVSKCQNLITHTLKVDKKGLDHYEQVVEEILHENYLELKIKSIGDDGQIQEKEVNPQFVSNGYHSEVVGSFVNQEGKRKTTIMILNDRGDALGQFTVDEKIDQNQYADYKFDGQDIKDIIKNEVDQKKDKNGTTTLKRLRSTQVGKKTYDCYFEEVVGKDGKKRLTLIMKNDEEEIIKKELDPSFMADSYECYLEQRMEDIDNGKNLVFRNSKNKMFKLKELKLDDDNINHENYDQIEDVFDQQGKRTGTVFVKNTPKESIKTHKLRPTLIGSQYFQITINEIIDENKKKKATIIVSDERGQTVLMEDIQREIFGDNYYADVLNEVIDDNDHRKATIQIKDENNQDLATFELSPEVQNFYSDLKSGIIEEIINDKGRKKITVLNKDDRKKILEVIEEENEGSDRDTNLKKQDKMEEFEKLFKKFGGKQNPNRLSVNMNNKKGSIRNKAQTINVLQKKQDKKFDSFGKKPTTDPETKEILEEIEARKKSTLKQQKEEPNVFKDEETHQDRKKSSVNDNELKQNIMNQIEENKRASFKKNSVNEQTLNQVKDLNKNNNNINDEELKKHVSLLLNQEKDKMILELMNDLVKKSDSNEPENEMEKFLKYCREELIYDKSYNDQILMVSLFYFFLKKKQGWKLEK